MRTDYFVLMNASGVTSNEKVVTRFRRFRTIEEAEKMVWEWLEYFLDVRCVPEAQEAELRKSHYGMLPEDVFICPTVKTPADLTKYNDFYDLGGLGRIFNILLEPVYDGESARQVCSDIDREYGHQREEQRRRKTDESLSGRLPPVLRVRRPGGPRGGRGADELYRTGRFQHHRGLTSKYFNK